MKFIGFFLVLFLSLNCSNSFPQNIAKGRKYLFSAQPNYSKSRTGNALVSLTDGYMQQGASPTFWTNGKSVGWQHLDRINIDLDLGNVQHISKITLNTATGVSAGVFLAKNILVFSSKDRSTYSYIGDLVYDILSNKQKVGEKSVINLNLGNINIDGRFLKFVILPSGNYFFVDEIQVFSQKNKGSGQPYKNYKLDNLDNAIEDILTSRLSVLSSSSKKDNFLVKNQISNKKESFSVKEVKYSSQMLSMDDSNFSSPNNIVSLLGGNEIRVFRVSNNTSSNKSFSFQKINNNIDVSLGKIKSVSNSRNRGLLDAIKFIDGNKIVLAPNEISYILLKYKVKSAGDYNITLKFVADDNSVNLEFPLRGRVLIPNGTSTLHGINWSYLEYPQIKNIALQATRDLEIHGIDTYPVNRGILLKAKSDKQAFNSYFSGINRNSKILLFFNFATNEAKKAISSDKFMSDQWKKSFKDHLSLIYSSLNSLGFRDIYVYPYDEISAESFNDFKNMTTWIRSDLKYKCYATVLSGSFIQAGNYVDLIQYNVKAVNSFDQLNKISAEKWLYDIIGSSRDVDPISYRLLSWKAYLYNFKGVGFWNYSKTTRPNNDFRVNYINGRQDYSVIYNDEQGNLMSSMRWESFYLGLEDYRKLQLVEKKRGRSFVKSLINSMLSDSGELNRVNVLDALNKELLVNN